MRLKVVVVVCDRDELFECFLKSYMVARNQVAVIEIDLCIVANKCTQSVGGVIDKYSNILSEVIYLNERFQAPQARNQALHDKYDYDWIAFFDDDVIIPEHYFKVLCDFLKFDNFVAIGGPNLTPPSSGRFETISGRILQSYWVTGPFSYRYRLAQSGEYNSDIPYILCNLVVRSSVLPDEGFRLPLGEENDLIKALLKKQGRLYFENRLYVYHFRRSSKSEYLQQVFKYGLGRSLLLMKWHSGFILNRRIGCRLATYLLRYILLPIWIIFYLPVAFIFSVYTSWLYGEAFWVWLGLSLNTHIYYFWGLTSFELKNRS